MKQSNFFQKNGVFIFLLTILGLVCCYFWFQNKKETTLVSSPESLSSEVFSNFPRSKRSLEESSIPIGDCV
ncbi:MAG: hypothetical protein Q8894_02465 [Sweet potato little leaf phytoplasma]|nr:hypothetical protein [Candidatus Phytoplasma australasiaticum]MDV3185752.1 hypothetical protein [Candidatus Phytoplasma australasiaticum]MDV3204623.1 hypothetical protein [Sweet potato little leaf phytoplasma]